MPARFSQSKDLGDQTEGANGGGSGQTPTNPQEGEDLLRKQAVEKARGVFTDPGVVFLTPESWERASLEAMMKGQSHIKDGGFEKRFTAFFFAPSDREARVHPGQNKCLREAPLNKLRLSGFCHAVDSIMTECKDTVVIGVGRAEPNLEIVKQVVKELKWDHTVLQAITSREGYDTFIQEGSPSCKRRRIHGKIATRQHIVRYLCNERDS